MVYLVYEELGTIFREFLSFFIKAEDIAHKSGEPLYELNLDDKSIHLPVQNIFFGDAREGIMSFHHLKKELFSAYLVTATYLRDKMPYKNK